MRIVFDIETDGLTNPTKVWLIVCKDLDDKSLYVFRRPSDDAKVLEEFKAFASRVKLWVGHNCIDYDCPVLSSLLNIEIPLDCVHDTYIISKLMDFSRDHHSIESYGEEFGIEKIQFSDYSKFSEEMEAYCVRDVDITVSLYRKACRREFKPYWHSVINTERDFASVCRSLHHTGFSFNGVGCSRLLDKTHLELTELDDKLLSEFPPRLALIREVTPERTKHGTLHRKDFRWVDDGDLSRFNGGSFCRCSLLPFNPDSHKQRIEILNEAGWLPTEKTKTHVECERESRRRVRDASIEWDLKLKSLAIYGWKVNDTNLNTLPASAPPAAKTLARRIIVESRRRTLTEWLGLTSDDGRIHGTFQSIGAWTQRMSHQKPNMANIANSEDLNGKEKYLGADMRSLFIAKPGSLLIGVDADSIQLRIFAHYLQDEELIHAIVNGSKANKTDPHSINSKILGRACKSRQAAKRFLYALFLGAGLGKLAQILECSESQAQEALDNLMCQYSAWELLKQERMQKDAQRGYFTGLDGRLVQVPGSTVSERRHLMMSGYLQNGEALIMKLATLRWLSLLRAMDLPLWRLVNLVHDEWQTEVDTKDYYKAKEIAEVQCFSLTKIGEELNMRCPLKGTYGDNHEDINTWTIGKNWKVTH